MYLVLTFYKNVSKECVLGMCLGSDERLTLETTASDNSLRCMIHIIN